MIFTATNLAVRCANHGKVVISMSEAKKGLPEELLTLLKQLVAQRNIRIAGWVLYAFFIRNWKLSEEHASYYTLRYFQKYYPRQWEKYQSHAEGR